MKILASFFAIAVLAQEGSNLPQVDSESAIPETETPADKDLTPYIEDWLYDYAKDPESVRLDLVTPARHMDVVLKRGIFGKDEWTGWIACYRMNAKNSYGAYTGYKPVVALLTDEDRLLVWVVEHEYSYAQKMANNYC